MSSNIIIDSRKLFAFEGLFELGDYAGRPKEWLDILWSELVKQPVLMNEFLYYLDNHTFSDTLICEGYSLSDMYVFQMSRYNLIRDIGKNTSSCNKESMVLGAFYDMTCMLKNPEKYKKKLSDGPGMDQL